MRRANRGVIVLAASLVAFTACVMEFGIEPPAPAAIEPGAATADVTAIVPTQASDTPDPSTSAAAPELPAVDAEEPDPNSQAAVVGTDPPVAQQQQVVPSATVEVTEETQVALPGVTVLDGTPGSSYQFDGSLSPSDLTKTTWLFDISGLAPGSPTSSSRSVLLQMMCQSSDLQWHLQGQAHSSDLPCSDSLSTYVTAENHALTVVVFLRPEAQAEVTYTLSLDIHNPF